jgi:hypothetical protein
MTKCFKCEGAAFRVQEISPGGAAFKMFTVQCAKCQTPIGVTDYYNAGSLLKKQEKAIADLTKKIDYLQATVGRIAQAMRQ